MAIVLDGLTLPNDLVIKDEFNFTPVVQNQKRSLSGALILQESVKIKGRKIQLFGDETSAWISRSDLVLLKAKVDTVDHDMVLVFDNDTYNVRFDYSNAALSATPVVECSDPEDDAPYYIVINLITV